MVIICLFNGMRIVVLFWNIVCVFGEWRSGVRTRLMRARNWFTVMLGTELDVEIIRRSVYVLSIKVACCLVGMVGAIVDVLSVGRRFRKARSMLALRTCVELMRGERGGRWNALHRQVARCE